MARVSGRTRFAIAASMPAVPVPDTANENAPSPARKTDASRVRISSRIAIIAGSRWLRPGAVMARMTRSETGLGPGPSSSRSATWGVDACGIEQTPDLLHAVSGEGTERRTRVAAGQAGQVHRGLQAGDAESCRHGPRQRGQPLLA